MKNKIKLGIALIRSIIMLPQIIGYFLNNKVREDLAVWQKTYAPFNNSFLAYIYLLTWEQQYRNVLYNRLKYKSLFTPPLNSLFINTPTIGKGLLIQHGFSTIITAKSIGDNCTICQQVTIGYTSDGKCPVIGNNVKICAGAIVVGGIHIGDNSVIGAGAIVVDDVPENSVVCSPKARVVKRIGAN